MIKSPKSSLAILLATALACSLFAVGCGGGSSTTAPPPLTKQEFNKRAVAICQKAFNKRNARYEAYVRTHAPPTTTEIVTRYVFPTQEEIARALAALGPPQGEQDQITSLVTGIEKDVQEARKNPPHFGLFFNDVDDIAKERGLISCIVAL